MLRAVPDAFDIYIHGKIIEIVWALLNVSISRVYDVSFLNVT
jgi:hypothetical protein